MKLLHAREPMPTSVWAGVYTEMQAARAATLYGEACASCHGDRLEGGEFPPLSGSEFLKPWNEKSVRALFERVRTTMPLDKPGSLTPAQTADITALILNVNKFPAGPTELPQTTAELEAIRIEVAKPSTTP